MTGGGGLLLAHDATLLDLPDAWLNALDQQEFTDVLPLLRRTFSTFDACERRLLGEQVRRQAAVRPEAASAHGNEGWDVEEARGLAAVRPLARLLGAGR